MATNKNTINVYRDWREIFQFLSDEDAGKLIKHFFDYVNDKNPEEPNGIIGMAWIPIKSQLKRDLKKWENICERNAKNGSKGGRPKNPVGYLGKSENPEKPQKADKDKDKDKDINKKNIKKKFIEPTIEEVRSYFKEKGYAVGADKFYYFYSSKGWIVGKSKMKNWKMAASGWMTRNKTEDDPYKRKPRFIG